MTSTSEANELTPQFCVGLRPHNVYRLGCLNPRYILMYDVWLISIPTTLHYWIFVLWMLSVNRSFSARFNVWLNIDPSSSTTVFLLGNAGILHSKIKIRLLSTRYQLAKKTNEQDIYYDSLSFLLTSSALTLGFLCIFPMGDEFSAER